MIAHGGAAGALAEVLAFLLPLALFALLSWRARRATESEDGSGNEDDAPEPPSLEDRY